MYYTPKIIQSLFPSIVWRIPNLGNEVFLTFDDGPDPEATPRVLDILGDHNAKATFFCLGKQVEKYPALFDRIKKEGHAIGNHTYSHLSGWMTANKKYFADIDRADEIIGSKLFRPPYGRIRLSQMKVLREKYKIIMWDTMSGDYNLRLGVVDCLKNIESHASSGSVVLLHDSKNMQERICNILIPILGYLQNKGYILNIIQ